MRHLRGILFGNSTQYLLVVPNEILNGSSMKSPQKVPVGTQPQSPAGMTPRRPLNVPSKAHIDVSIRRPQVGRLSNTPIMISI